MSVVLWNGQGPVLADTSAWMVARRDARARDLLLAAVDQRDVAWCWPVRYELMVDARDAKGIAAVDRALDRLREVPVDQAVQRAVLSAMHDLASGGPPGAHRFPLADLTVAAAAQAAGLDVLHCDPAYDRLGALLGIGTPWLAEPGG